MAPDTIPGRDHELEVVERFLGRSPSGATGLLIEGEAGIGKTTIWREAVRMAEDRGPVLTSRASEAEARMSFAVLGDLLGPVLSDGLLEQLTDGQRRALEAALLLSGTTAARPDQRAVSLAVLALMRELAKSAPVTIAIDDVQWVDPPSARTLGFVLRRLETEPVAIVAAYRLEPGSEEPLELTRTLPGGLERLVLAPLDERALARVLRRGLDRRFPAPLVTKIHEQTGGNPFFAIEVGRALGAETPSLEPGEPLPVPRDLEELLRRRVSKLSPAARAAALVLAASPLPSQEVVEAAGATAAGIREACAATIVAALGSRLEFTHPLLGSAVYGDASAGERRLAHARLADVESDPEQRARHLALAAEVPNEEVAAALDDAAMHARNRGALLAAAELSALAATLTPGASDRAVTRLESAAVNLFDAGDGDGARRILEGLLDRLVPGAQRARTLFLLSFMCWGDLSRATELLAEALDQAGDDPGLRARILADTAWGEFETCRPGSAADVARTALGLAEPLADPFPKRHALSVLASAEAVLGLPTQHLIERAVALEVAPVGGESSGPSIVQGRLTLWAGDVQAARDVLEKTYDRFLEQGKAAGTWEIVGTLAEVELRAGRWDRAFDHVSNGLEIAADAGRGDEAVRILATKAAIEAATGLIEEARRDGLEALSLCERNGSRWNELAARAALGFLELSLKEPAAAHAWLRPAVTICDEMGLREPGACPFVPDEVEALIALGEIDEAERLTDQLEEQGRDLDRALALATSARCRGLIAGARREPAVAAAYLEHALAEHARAEYPFETARTLLVAGEVQRRMKKKRPARELLEQARDAFEELGAPTWAARARAGLARIGGRPPTPDGLTPTETEVARLVATGMTNREVARALFMSHHTVDANLRRVYRKLRVRSRTELARRF